MNLSYKGKILISTPESFGDIFSRSVILIVEHDTEGAFGLILNKRKDGKIKEVSEVFDYEMYMYEGGPVSQERLFFIIKDENAQTEGYFNLKDRYFLTEDIMGVVENVISGKISPKNIKIFSGYSGWGASQLETEIENKIWTVLDCPNIDYTEPSDYNLWKNIMNNLGGDFVLWANSPNDISMN